MLILIHSSKAMRSDPAGKRLHTPQLAAKAAELAGYLKTLSPAQLANSMKLSSELAKKTHALLASWTAQPAKQIAAMDAFIGDIYSGLQAPSFSALERKRADEKLRILSGLYGILQPLDGIHPYRLEMGYRLPSPAYANLYKFWGDAIAKTLPTNGLIVNLAAVEYSSAITPYVDAGRFVSPKFLTANPKTGKPSFVTVHAKVARGAFARWLIVNRIEKPADMLDFNEIGYKYEKAISTSSSPAFVAEEFGGTGLSIRLM